MHIVPFVGARLELARSFKLTTLKQLADTISVSVASLGHYENGLRQPSQDIVAALAAALHVRPGFFFEPLEDVWREEECSFRRRVTTAEGVKRRARAHGTLIGLVIGELAKAGIKAPSYNFPSIRAVSPDEIEAAAERCREQWKLGAGPIQHIGRVAEHHGAVLVRHLAHSDKIDAFARRGRYSIIVLNVARTSTSRWIFDVAHEIGHFVLHPGICTGSKDTESQANRFASALLLPRKTFAREFRARPFSWTHVFDLKRRWLTSASAIVHRGYDLGLIDAITYRRCYQHMSVQGWLKSEPFEPEFVAPEWLQSAMTLAAKRLGLSATVLSDRLHVAPETFADVTGQALPVQRPPAFRPRLVS
jgi:Zn-dependent peptidase ImmA (M78 family)/transcriptional regulator with XRE-family HTH domain